MNKTASTFLHGFLAIILATGLIFLTACGGGSKKKNEDEGPVASIHLVRLDLYKKLYREVSNGGQFLIATMTIENISKEDQKFKPKDFVIRRSPTEADPEPFEQNIEEKIAMPYQMEFGKEAMVRLFDKDVVVHPGFTMTKELVYQVPEDAELGDYEIRYVPGDEVYKFSDSEVEILDHREGTESTESGRNGRR